MRELSLQNSFAYDSVRPPTSRIRPYASRVLPPCCRNASATVILSTLISLPHHLCYENPNSCSSWIYHTCWMRIGAISTIQVFLWPLVSNLSKECHMYCICDLRPPRTCSQQMFVRPGPVTTYMYAPSGINCYKRISPQFKKINEFGFGQRNSLLATLAWILTQRHLTLG